MRRNADVHPSPDDLLVFIRSSAKVACEPVGIAGRFHRKWDTQVQSDRWEEGMASQQLKGETTASPAPSLQILIS